MTTKLVSISTLNKGSYIIVDGAACKIVDMESGKAGKHGHAKIKLTAVGILDNKKRMMVIPSGENVEVPIVEKRTAQVLSVNGNMANVMDTESFETFDLEIPPELQSSVRENTYVLYWQVLSERVMKQVKSQGE